VIEYPTLNSSVVMGFVMCMCGICFNPLCCVIGWTKGTFTFTFTFTFSF
jgi:hypothetical protein